MKDKEFRFSRFARSLLRRYADEEMLLSAEEDLAERYRQALKEKGVLRVRVQSVFQTTSLFLSFFVETIIWRMTMFRSYLKVALRALRRQKGYSFINITGLTIGMACFILIGLWVKDELSFDRFHEKKDRIFRVVNKTQGGDFIPNPTYALAPALKSLYPEVEEVARVWPWYGSLVTYVDKKFEEDNICLTDPGFFRMFTFPFIKGNPDTALNNRDAIVITESTAKKYFGNEDPIGQALYLAREETDFTVTGVIEDIPANSHIQFDLVTRVELLGEDRLARWEEWMGPCYVLLRPNMSAEAFTAKIEGIYRENEDPEATYSAVLQPLTKVHLYERVRPGSIKKVTIFSVIAVFILLMACVNFMNLTTARSSRRAREVGLRKVIGAVRSQLIRQFLGEALVVTFLSLGLSLLLVEITLPQFNLFTGKSLTLLSKANLSIILTLILATVVTGLLAGSYPAFFLSSFRPVNILKSQPRFGAKGSGMRKLLIIFQFVISVGLITCTLVVSKQLRFIQKHDIGIDRENVVILINNPTLQTRFDAFKNELLTIPGIRYVTSAAQGPTDIGQSFSIDWEGNPDEDMLGIDYTVVDYDFFKTFNMEITQGRGFSQEFATDMKDACVITETTALRMRLENPIGTVLYMAHPAWPESFRRARVIGVVKDFHARTLHNPLRPFVFRMYRPWHTFVFIKIEGTRVQETLAKIESTFISHTEGYPYRYFFYEDFYDRQYQPEWRLGRLFNSFSLLSILISCLGLFGLGAYMAEQKTKEIGIRKVLGASIPGIVTLTAKEFIKCIAIANLVAWPLAYVVMRGWLQDFAYKVSIGPLIFILASALTLFIAFVTVGYNSIKAALANPVDSLRYE
ncbi:MAG TPA: ABC transporter permease [Candidatus Heimdallarchaeota archaeon]|nr:ABC transporter permease [Candidatus Heimdallarchaeota archaeon]